MPARINAEERRGHVVRAGFAQVVAEGVEGLTLRKVAARAGLNIGSVRHFFDGHEDLLAAVAQEAGDRMGRRLAAYPPERLSGLKGEAAVDALQELIEQVLPVDAARREEAIVVVEFIRASRVRAVFAPAADRMARDLHRVIEDALSRVGAAERTRHVTAVIGGLTLDAVTPHGAPSVEEVRATLRGVLRLVVTA
ncbi:TetR family transcriptional regulator C-terminal domain-containing protein [Corynebacterium mastitidis]|uniref:TetR family transcriptional regulator n=1 Tax=Corynebacterium mastitidis TaxID=161890 RepID=A0A2N0X6X3_9CORY|nr:TetR family transcriptional regulator C-terminal domain-containing protein [Corynebacterium mastitidis]MCH6196185.1 TetR family transcriptional regulator C-terminal domain-containing protein [Corynebacterium mastitidis]PKF68447.1 TetR family transcriptional regulator [Corynebacterium mastitidis]